MITIPRTALFSLLLILLTLPWTAGCAATGTKRAANTISRADSLRVEYAQLRGQIGVTIASLNSVYDAREGDLAAAFKTFKKDRSNLMNQVQRVQSGNSSLRSSLNDQLEGWREENEELTNEDLKAHAEQRRQETSAHFEKVKGDLDQAKKDLDGFFTLLSELETVMANDLNASGVAALKDLIKDAGDKGGVAKEHLVKVEGALEKLERTLIAGQPAKTE